MRSLAQYLLPTMAVTLVVTAMASAALAQSSQRLSLADRVARLEQQAAGQGGGQSTLELLNRINELQSELQTLRGLVEQQAFEIDQLKRRQREQYIDLDTRLGRIEGGAVGLETERVPGIPASTDGDSVVSGLEPGRIPVDDAELRAAIEQEIRTAPESERPPRPVAAVVDPAAERALYDQAFAALREGRYAEASRRFSEFIEAFPDSMLAGNAMYWLGESFYVTQDFRRALETFQELLRRYPDSSKVGDALLKIGYSHYELREWDAAEAALTRVVQEYPDSTLSRLAQGRLRALRLERR